MPLVRKPPVLMLIASTRVSLPLGRRNARPPHAAELGSRRQAFTVSSRGWELIAPLILMWYQSTVMLKLRRKLGVSTTPAVQVLAVSSSKFGLPPLKPLMLWISAGA